MTAFWLISVPAVWWLHWIEFVASAGLATAAICCLFEASICRTGMNLQPDTWRLSAGEDSCGGLHR